MNCRLGLWPRIHEGAKRRGRPRGADRERGNYRTGRPRGRLIGKAVHYWHLARARYPWYYLLSFFVPIHHRRPIFIVGCPRSGTSLLFRLFMRSPILGSLGREGNRVWEHYHPASEKGWVSHVLDETDVSRLENSQRDDWRSSRSVVWPLVAPSLNNCFRIPY